MAVLNQIAETLLSSTASVDMKTPSVKKTLYTVPTGKTMIVTKIVVRSVSATLAGGTSYAFGGTLTCSDWKSGVDLHLITGSTLYYVIANDNPSTVSTMQVAGTAFGMYITTGATNAATATIDVFGYLF